MVQELVTLISENPVLLWGGIILAAALFIAMRYLEDMSEEKLKPPRPSSLEDIVKPKIREQLENRGKRPENTYFQIGNETKGEVNLYVKTEMPNQLIDPNPHNDSEHVDEQDLESVKVRVIQIKSSNTYDKIARFLRNLLRMDAPSQDKIYIFREDSFMDYPGGNMVVPDKILSYNFAGMEVEIDPSTRNVVNQAVSTEVSEKVLAALPNYTEKVDYLFPLHSQEVSKIKKEGEFRDEGGGFG